MNPAGTGLTVKNIAYIPAFLLGLSMENYTILAIFMLIDIITGVMKAYRIGGGHSIRSFRLQAGILSKVCILLLPLLMVWTGRGIGVDLIIFAKGFLGMLILAEAYSILGNVFAVYRGVDVHEFDAMSFVLRKLQSGIESMLKANK